MKEYKFEDYFSHLNIPETWNTLEEFVEWYMDSKMPLMIPIDSEVYFTDDASSLIMFRQDCYQVELYLNYPKSVVPMHSHPGMDLIAMQIGKMSNLKCGLPYKLLKDGEEHNGIFPSEKGTVFLTFQKWDLNVKMTSASVNWNGKTVGPKHQKLIKRHFPNVKIINGISMLTKEMLY
jgi:hypothetical protein